ncbi:hypothetical protein TNCV_1425091 [Trichonephila clavipes]|nr:hypothetical protein TNCV_1425091 [Trichonephila clavipes]
MPWGLGSNRGEDMDVCKCIVPLRHGGTLNSHRAASLLVRLVEGKERRSRPSERDAVTLCFRFLTKNENLQCLKTYNVHRAIGVQWARDKMGRDRQRWSKNKRSKKELGGERREVYKESERARRGLDSREPFVDPSAREKTIASPRSMAGSELWRLDFRVLTLGLRPL